MSAEIAPPTSSYARLTRDQLAVVVPELLLIGQLIDRSGMAWCISAFGREEMAQIAIEEWAAASPIYTRRMQEALGYAPDVAGQGDVVTIFKGLQFDIGAPPQFMDFRYTVHDRWHGSFELAHCGALMDVEPMGPDYVRSMCDDIEDPTFDATAVATNPRAQVRPIHRPPRPPDSAGPHCAWTVIIDESHPPVEGIPALAINETSRAATLELAPIDPRDEGLSDYSGPLLADVDFTAFSHSALVRMADEVCLQMHLLDRGFALAVAARASSAEQVLEIRRRQLCGVAGVAAERLARALDVTRDEAGAREVLALHPIFNPARYVPAGAAADEAWHSLCGPDWPDALRAITRAVDPHLDAEVVGTADDWHVSVVRRPEPLPEDGNVAVVRFSTGAAFAFEARRSIPITAV